MEIEVNEIGRCGDVTVNEIVMRASSGVKVTCLSYGATVNSAFIPDRNGFLEEVILCAPFEELISSESQKPKYVGTIGRVANRIAKGRFQLDEVEYSLAINNGENHLHGGIRGFDKQVWDFTLIREERRVGARFTLSSPDMEEGYPGNVEVVAEYCLTDSNTLTMKFLASTDKSTPVNMTNHTFWNLSGSFRSSIKSHLLQLSCGGYLPIDAGLIPLGKIASVEGTPFDFTSPRSLGSAIDQISHNGVSGIDHCFISSNQLLFPNQVQHVATLTDPNSGRQLLIQSNQPAIQVYTGNFLPILSVAAAAEEEEEDGGRDPFHQHNGVCLENQGYPNAVNESNFPSIILHPGEEYVHESVYSFRLHQ
jgi:aldose 1-epimerase